MMRGIIKYVRYRIRSKLSRHSHFNAASELHEHAPLTIRKAEGEQNELLSYKPAWNVEAATVSLDGTGRYEAAGNLML